MRGQEYAEPLCLHGDADVYEKTSKQEKEEFHVLCWRLTLFERLRLQVTSVQSLYHCLVEGKDPFNSCYMD